MTRAHCKSTTSCSHRPRTTDGIKIPLKRQLQQRLQNARADSLFLGPMVRFGFPLSTHANCWADWMMMICITVASTTLASSFSPTFVAFTSASRFWSLKAKLQRRLQKSLSYFLRTTNGVQRGSIDAHEIWADPIVGSILWTDVVLSHMTRSGTIEVVIWRRKKQSRPSLTNN